jgi:protein gp37
MNKQEKAKNGQVTGRGIQWTDYTHNPVGGCKHGCRWEMPDGSIATCYAEDVANKFRRAYPQGFEHHYFRPQNLNDPLKIKQPAKIFMDSMSDLMGHWVPEDQINQVLSVCRQAHWHTFQLLTKNAPRLLNFDYPDNVWVGASSPPDQMWGKEMDSNQQVRMLDKILKTLGQVKAPVRWMSIEPLSWDISQIVADNEPLQWAVIGAATNGPKVYQPEPAHVTRLLEVFDRQKVPVFFKGNIWGNPAIKEWREYFPGFVPSRFMGMDLGKHALPTGKVKESGAMEQLAIEF